MQYDIQPSPTRTGNLLRSDVPGYEQNTWRPSISFTGATTGITYDRQVGGQVKIGRMTFLNFYIRLTSKGAANGNVHIHGFPDRFDGNEVVDGINENTGMQQHIFWANLNTNIIALAFRPSSISNIHTMELLRITAATNSFSANLTDADLTDTTILFGSVFYPSRTKNR